MIFANSVAGPLKNPSDLGSKAGQAGSLGHGVPDESDYLNGTGKKERKCVDF